MYRAIHTHKIHIYHLVLTGKTEETINLCSLCISCYLNLLQKVLSIKTSDNKSDKAKTNWWARDQRMNFGDCWRVEGRGATAKTTRAGELEVRSERMPCPQGTDGFILRDMESRWRTWSRLVIWNRNNAFTAYLEETQKALPNPPCRTRGILLSWRSGKDLLEL